MRVCGCERREYVRGEVFVSEVVYCECAECVKCRCVLSVFGAVVCMCAYLGTVLLRM